VCSKRPTQVKSAEAAYTILLCASLSTEICSAGATFIGLQCWGFLHIGLQCGGGGCCLHRFTVQGLPIYVYSAGAAYLGLQCRGCLHRLTVQGLPN
jgi:hypothetical protein